MPSLPDLLNGLPEVARIVLVLSAVAVAGLALGHVKIGGVGLGIGGVLFAGLAAGHLAAAGGVTFDAHILHFVREFGLILFVYTIGVQVGPGFFAALKRQGLGLNLYAAAVVALGGLTAAAVHLGAGVPLDAVLGVYSGAVTNTPSLAAGQQMLQAVGAPAEALTTPGLGYAVAYPFGIAGILLTMTLVRVLFRIDVAAEAAAFEAKRRAAAARLETLDVRVRDPSAAGTELRAVLAEVGGRAVASRLLRDGRLRVAHAGTRLAPDDVVHLVGPRDALEALQARLGPVSEVPLTTKGTDLRWERLVVTQPQVLGRTIAQLAVADAYDVVISRVNRAGVELTPSSSLHLQFGDILTAIGRPEDIARLAAVLGNAEHRLQHVALMPVFLGIALGVVLGSIPFHLPGLPAPLKLGLAGGPLIAAILLARLGHLGPLVWFMPPAANMALREIGIVLFLGVVGLASGGRFVETLVDGPGLAWMGWGALVTLVPLATVALVARAFGRLDHLTLCGLLAGSMTDPPALAFANAQSPVAAASLAYATVYPLVMALRILSPQILVLALW